jgi:drug/metabolite transporter (DMT)-like permease
MTTIAQPRPLRAEKAAIPRSVYIALVIGILAGASAALSTKYALAEGASALMIAFFRLSAATLLLTPIVLARHRDDLRKLTRRDLLLLTFGGMWMALHFVLWSASLAYASVLVATVIVCSSPIWTAVFEIAFLRARLTRMIAIGLVLAVGGNVVIALSGSAEGGTNEALGGFIALVAAIAIAAQRTIGRSLRLHIPLFPYLWVMYGVGALTLLPIMIVTGTPFIGYTPSAYFWMFLLTLLPQLLGHGAFNYALGYFSATFTSLIIQTQPPIASLIAFFALGEVPSWLQVIGSAVIVMGVVMAIQGRRMASGAASPPPPPAGASPH